MTRSKKITLTLVTLIASSLIAACSSSSDHSSSSSSGSSTGPSGASAKPSKAKPLAGKKIAVAELGTTPTFAEINGNFSKLFDEAGAKTTIYNNNLDGTTALNNARLIASAKPNLVVEWLPVQSEYPAVNKIFSDAKIPCIGLNTKPPAGGWCKYANELDQKTFGVQGTIAGYAAKAKGWNGSNTNLIMAVEPEEGESNVDAAAYYYQALTAILPGFRSMPSYLAITPKTTTYGPQTQVVSGGGETPSVAATSVRAALQNVPAKHNIILMVENDGVAPAALNATVQAGRKPSQVITTMITGGLAMLQDLGKNPSVVGGASLFFPEWGEYVVAMSKAMLDGQTDLPDMTYLPTVGIIPNGQTPPSGGVVRSGPAIGTPIQTFSTYYSNTKTDIPTSLPPLVANTKPAAGYFTGTYGNSYLAKTGVFQFFGNVKGLK